ncbi:MAG: hypothetical protein EBR82_81515 [Caulobacteraceae bacterium]|nr:hypothetical protein [Caulobacteraceae bacterium]
MIYLLLIAAAAVVFWPNLALPRLAPPAGETYQSAIADLANVRRRLVRTQRLDEPVKKAIDTLTLALVAGSDE